MWAAAQGAVYVGGARGVCPGRKCGQDRRWLSYSMGRFRKGKRQKTQDLWQLAGGLGTHDSGGEDDQDQTTTEGLGTHDSGGEDDQDQTITEGLGTHDSSRENDEQGNIQSSPQTRDQGQTRTEGEENYTKDNKTQGIMEKCQWDLKRIRFHHKRLTRFDDFFHTYKKVHQALLREHKDSLKIKKKTHRVDVERWKQRKQGRRGVYVSTMTKPFKFEKPRNTVQTKKMSNKSKVEEKDTDTDATLFKQDTQPQLDTEPTIQTNIATLLEEAGRPPSTKMQEDEQLLQSLWKRERTEVVVAVIPSANRSGSSFLIHHSELCSLRPHQWLTGEVMEGLFHLFAKQLNLGRAIFLLDHYTAGVILFGTSDRVRQHSLRKYTGSYWSVVVTSSAKSAVFLLDPMANKSKKAESADAAKRIQDYMLFRKIAFGKNDWGRLRWRGLTMDHPVQRDTCSCGVIVTMMAKAVMEAYPALPAMSFGTSKKEMASERTKFALELLSDSVLDLDSYCVMCCASKPPGSGPPMTRWIQCDTCERWFHEECLDLEEESLLKAPFAPFATKKMIYVPTCLSC
ncbi:uncharacterized protein LOC113744953 [Larimichthys crocea]|uniref:uncharacterized protein LOC113744953 n=1 Tax=Larimichthys crocea TaxID=215358 RepID=UPI000F5F0394|nr:uncharacterized protein LOC113744953 [Larimichthys crocea]